MVRVSFYLYGDYGAKQVERHLGVFDMPGVPQHGQTVVLPWTSQEPHRFRVLSVTWEPANTEEHDVLIVVAPR